MWERLKGQGNDLRGHSKLAHAAAFNPGVKQFEGVERNVGGEAEGGLIHGVKSDAAVFDSERGESSVAGLIEIGV
jgi:hypothetical protein